LCENKERVANLERNVWRSINGWWLRLPLRHCVALLDVSVTVIAVVGIAE
jgi:hypothetical protein